MPSGGGSVVPIERIPFSHSVLNALECLNASWQMCMHACMHELSPNLSFSYVAELCSCVQDVHGCIHQVTPRTAVDTFTIEVPAFDSALLAK